VCSKGQLVSSLASAVKPKGAASVLELGCGVGVASLCLGARVSGLKITGVELQSDYAALAERNAVENGVRFEVVTGDVEDLPLDVRQRSFDHVIANPPYFETIVSQKCGEIEIYPIVSRGNRPASRVIVSARKGSRTPLVLHPPKVVHANAEHGVDGDDYAQWAKSVLRDGASLN